MLMLQGVLKPFKHFPRITEWQKQYLVELRGFIRRFKFLVLVGDTSLGKTVLAKSLFGEAETYYCDMQTAEEADLRRFRHGIDKALLLDEITWQQVISHKVMFQAGIDGVELSRSKCNQHSYWRFLYGVPIICCTNQWLPPEGARQRGEGLTRDRPMSSRRQCGSSSESEQALFDRIAKKDRDWIQRNSVQVDISEAVWQEDAGAGV